MGCGCRCSEEKKSTHNTQTQSIPDGGKEGVREGVCGKVKVGVANTPQ